LFQKNHDIPTHLLKTASGNFCRLLITASSPLTGLGEGGFGKRSESLSKPELTVSFNAFQIGAPPV